MRPRDVSGWPRGQRWGGARTRPGVPGLRSAWSGHCPSDRPCLGSLSVLARVQEQLTSRWEGNQALAARTRDQLAQHEAGLMDLREALNRAVGTTREAEELNSRNQERLEEALVRNLPPPPLLSLPPLPSPSFTPHPSPSYPPPHPSCLCFCPSCSLLILQHWKQELSRDNATLRDTLQAASDTLARVSELLHGMDRAKEVSTSQDCTPGEVGRVCMQNVTPGVPDQGSERGLVGTRVPIRPLCPQEYEHLAASLDGAWTPLLEKIRAFSPASGKVDLVEAAEAHARQLDQLAHNLSRCGADEGCPKDTVRSLPRSQGLKGAQLVRWVLEGEVAALTGGRPHR